MSCIVNWLRSFQGYQQILVSRKVTAQAPAYPVHLRLGFPRLGIRELGFQWNSNARRAAGWRSLSGFLGKLNVIYDLDVCRGALEKLEQISMRTGTKLAG